ncbi:MAG: thioredoxin [Leptospirales bacterium]
MDSPVRCPSCHTPNRLDSRKDPENARCGKCGTRLVPLEPAGPLVVTDGTFDQMVLKSPVPVLLDLWAPWCGPCRMIAPILEDLSRKYHGRVRVAKLNVDENSHTASQMEAMSIPLLLFMKEGKVIQKLVGAYPAHEIERALQSIL